MLTYIIRRLLLMIPTLIGVTMVVFFIMAKAPGGFEAALDEGSVGAGVEARRLKQEMRNRYALDEPTYVQYFRWLNQVSPVGFKMSLDKEWSDAEREALQAQLIDRAWVQTPRQARTISAHILTVAAYAGLSIDQTLAKFDAAARQPIPRRTKDSATGKTVLVGPAAELFELIQSEPIKGFWEGIETNWKQGNPKDRAAVQKMAAAAEALTPRDGQVPAHGPQWALFQDPDYWASLDEQMAYVRQRAVNDLFAEVGYGVINKSRIMFGSIKLWDPDLGADRNSRSVYTLLTERLPITLIMNLITIPLIYIVSIIVGVLAARKRGGLFDVGSGVVMLGLYSVPVILAGTLMIAYLASSKYLQWFPTTGVHSLQADTMPLLPHFADDRFHRGYLLDFAWHMVLPITCLTYSGFAYLTKVMRGSVLETISADFIRTARAKGVAERQILFRHVLRNSMLPLITMAAAILPGLFVGSFVVEFIFSIQGMGLLTIEAAKGKDINIIMATTLVGSVLSLMSLLVRDILYAVADPRVTYD